MSDQTIFSNAELSLAAYATLTDPLTGSVDSIDVLIDEASMSDKQAREFAIRYPYIVTQFNDPASSFSATVFKDTSNNLTVAFRGTLEPHDIVTTDFNLWQRGAGYVSVR